MTALVKVGLWSVLIYATEWLHVRYVLLHDNEFSLTAFPLQLVCLATFLKVSESDSFDPYQVSLIWIYMHVCLGRCLSFNSDPLYMYAYFHYCVP